jgi:hypothetical protein
MLLIRQVKTSHSEDIFCISAFPIPKDSFSVSPISSRATKGQHRERAARHVQLNNHFKEEKGKIKKYRCETV